MILATSSRKSLARKAQEGRNRPVSNIARWWDKFYSNRRIWQIVALVGSIFLLLMVGISWLLQLRVFGEIKEENIATTAMTMIGGLIAISYVVLKYRERISVEISEQREEEQLADRKLREAVQLLSDEKAIVQISGVYGLVAVADEFAGPYRQRVVDLLCAYIRSNKNPEYAVVEATILSEIQKRVYVDHHNQSDLLGPNTFWHDCSFDFHGAIFFEKFKLNNIYIETRLDCSGAIFRQGMELKDIVINGGLDCSEAKFKQRVQIKTLIFQINNVNFNSAHFINGFDAQHFSYRESATKQKVTFFDAKFYMRSIDDIPFNYNFGADIDISYIDIPNRIAMTDSRKRVRIPKDASIIWNESEKLTGDE